ncbi:MAG: oxidoreductase [Deltaproteobacteria bacterium]|nr:oxidoreductase [Deltaproteobacteria bacterium]
MSKLKLGLYWAASCGGCDIAVLEIHEKVLDLLEVAEIVFWPCVMDFKYKDVENMRDEEIDVCLFNGAIRNEENQAVADLLRKKSKTLVAYGSCSMAGGIPGLANLNRRAEMFDRIYRTTESTDNPNGTLPKAMTDLGDGKTIALPEVYPHVKTLHQVVDVDYFIPGCPPTDEQTWAVIESIASGDLPAAGSVVGAGLKAVCDECPFEKTDAKVNQFKRPHEVIPDGTSCLMEQGLVCMGPSTRSGCRAQCLNANMPCRGCYGPAEGIADQGGKMIATIGSIIDSEDEKEIAKCVDQLVDPAGTLYRFGLPTSLLEKSKK